LENSNQHYIYDDAELADKEDPWLGRFIVDSRKYSDLTTSWNQLLLRSVHINSLVKPAPTGKQGRWRLETDIIKQRLKDGMLIVNMSADPFNRYEETVVDALSKLTDNFVVLSGDVTYFLNPKKQICFFPFWYLIQKYVYKTSATATTHYCQYKISSLNSNTRYHRVENFVKLKEKSYFDQLLFTMYSPWNESFEKHSTPKEWWNDDIVKKFELLRPALALQVKDSHDGQAITHPACTDSYVNYITETSTLDKTITVTEKTWKPIMAGQLGLWLSNPGAVGFLRLIGFDVFDDIMNNHLYDNETNLNRRIDMIHAVIDRLMTLDLAQVFHDTIDRRQANLDRFYSNTLEELLTAQCKDYQL
jgi:hypothetical protein